VKTLLLKGPFLFLIFVFGSTTDHLDELYKSELAVFGRSIFILVGHSHLAETKYSVGHSTRNINCRVVDKQAGGLVSAQDFAKALTLAS